MKNLPTMLGREVGGREELGDGKEYYQHFHFVYVLYCAFVNASTHTYVNMGKGQCRAPSLSLRFEIQGPSLNLELMNKLDWVTSEFQGPTCICPPSQHQGH